MTTQHPCVNYAQCTVENTTAQEGELPGPRITQLIESRVKSQSQTGQTAQPGPQGYVVGLQ